MAKKAHPLAGKKVKLKVNDNPDFQTGDVFSVEDYWENVSGDSWMNATGNPAALKYAMRSAMCGLPIDNEVVYGKVGAYGHLVHVSELGEAVK